jgi:hypothetical protein
MEKDHPAKLAYDKLSGGEDDGGDSKPGVNIFDEPEPDGPDDGGEGSDDDWDRDPSLEPGDDGGDYARPGDDDWEDDDEPSDTGTEKPAQIIDPKALLDDMDIDYEETEDENGNKKYELEDGRELTFTDTGVVIDDDGNEEIDQWPYPPENYGYETVKDPEADWRDLPVVPHDQWAEEGQDYLSKNFPEENKEARIPTYGSFQETQVQWVKDNITFKD